MRRQARSSHGQTGLHRAMCTSARRALLVHDGFRPIRVINHATSSPLAQPRHFRQTLPVDNKRCLHSQPSASQGGNGCRTNRRTPQRRNISVIADDANRGRLWEEPSFEPRRTMTRRTDRLLCGDRASTTIPTSRTSVSISPPVKQPAAPRVAACPTISVTEPANQGSPIRVSQFRQHVGATFFATRL